MDFIFIIEIALFIILMGMSGFFSSSETALLSLDSFHLEQMKKDKNTNIGLIEKLLAQPRRLSAGAVVAIVVGEFGGAEGRNRDQRK